MAAVRWPVSKAMERWGVARTTVLRWLREGRVPGEQRQTLRGPVWFVLDSERPSPSLAPIAYKPRSRSQPAAETEAEADEVYEPDDDSDFSDLDEEDEDV